MKSYTLLLVTLFLCLQIDCISQSHYDSTFVQSIINLEIKEREKKFDAFPIYSISENSNASLKSDSIYTNYPFGKEIDWTSFKITPKNGFFVNDKLIDSCFFIHAPIFNENQDKFKIVFEIRYLDNSSSFELDYYKKRRGKWSYVRTVETFSF